MMSILNFRSVDGEKEEGFEQSNLIGDLILHS